MISQKDYPFILYNNRSIKGVVQNFINFKNIDSNKLIEIEKRLDNIQSIYNQGKTIGIDQKDLNINCNDINYSLKDLNSLTTKMNNAYLTKSDNDWLNNRGITDDIIKHLNLKSLSCFKNRKDLETLGATVHPLLSTILEDGIEEGGIIIPLYENNLLVNCTIRKLSDIGKLKYTQSCPDSDVWGLNNIKQNSDVWLTEGIFDMGALYKEGAPSTSVSSAMWSSIQIYKLLSKEPKNIHIFADNDQTGLRCAKILQTLFISFNINSKTYISTKCKDPAEHFLEKKLDWTDIKEISITKEMILNKEDQIFNFTKYLKSRNF